MSNILLLDVGSGHPPGQAALLGEGFYYRHGTTSAAARVGNWTSTANFNDGNPEDTSTGETATGLLGTNGLQIFGTAGAPSGCALTITYEGTPTVTYEASTDGDSWVTLTDNSGTSWTTHGAVASEYKLATFADGSTVYKYYRVKFVVDVSGPKITDLQFLQSFVPSITANLHTNLDGSRNVYTDTGATTIGDNHADTIKAWTDLTAAKNFSNATGCKWHRRTPATGTFAGGLPAMQMVDSTSSPSAYYLLARASHLANTLDTAFTMYIVAIRPSTSTNEAYVCHTTNVGGGFQVRVFDTFTNYTGGFMFGSPTCRRGGTGATSASSSSGQGGVMGFSFDGTWQYGVFNDQVVGETGSITLGFSPEDCQLSTGTSTNAFVGYIYKVLMYSAAHTPAQMRTISSELRTFYGITDLPSLFVLGNSITAGFGAYTDPWVAQMDDTDAVQIEYKSIAAIGNTTLQQATSAANQASWKWGNFLLEDYVTASGTPTRTVIDHTSAPWTTNSEVGKSFLIDSGAIRGLAQTIASNDTDTITLTSPGLAVAPATGVSTKVFAIPTQSNKNCAIVFEMTNDLFSNAATDGPTANGSVKADTPIYQRFINTCLAMKGAGHRVIACTMIPRNEAGEPTNYQADWAILNGWIRADYTQYADALCDFTTLVQFENIAAIVTYSSHWIDSTHPSNTGGAVLAAKVVQVVEALID